MESHVLKLKKTLKQEGGDGGSERMLLDALAELQTVTATTALLASTEVGLVVNRLRKHAREKVSARAKAVIRKWKEDVAREGVVDIKKSASVKREEEAAKKLTGGVPDKSPGSSPKKKASQVVATGPASVTKEAPSTSNAVPLAAPGVPATSPTKDTPRTPVKPAPINVEPKSPSLSKTTSKESLPSTGASTPHSAIPSDSAHLTELNGIALVPGKNRSAKADGVTLPKPGGEPMRLKCAEMLYVALASNTNAESSLVAKHAALVEQAVFSTNTTDEAYRDKVRSLFANLRDPSNPSLRLRVLAGELAAERLCGMSAQELKSRERVEEEERIRAENLFKARGAAPQEAETDQFKCGKCRQRKCRYYQMQTRSADEPMTTFVTCTNCNNKWKFC